MTSGVRVSAMWSASPAPRSLSAWRGLGDHETTAERRGGRSAVGPVRYPVPVVPFGTLPILRRLFPGVNVAVGPARQTSQGRRGGMTSPRWQSCGPPRHQADSTTHSRPTNLRRVAACRVVEPAPAPACSLVKTTSTGQAGPRLFVHRYAAALVAHSNAVRAQCDEDLLAVAAQGLVDCVVDNLPQAASAPWCRSSRCTSRAVFELPRDPPRPAAGAVPRTHGFPLLGWLLARAESPRCQRSNQSRGAIRLRVVTRIVDGSTAAW